MLSWRFFLAVIISSPVRCAFVLEFALPAPLWLAIDLDSRSLADALPG